MIKYLVVTKKGNYPYKRKEDAEAAFKKMLADKTTKKKPQLMYKHIWCYRPKNREDYCQISGETLEQALVNKKNVYQICKDMGIYGPHKGALDKIELKKRNGKIFMLVSGWTFSAPKTDDSVSWEDMFHDEDYHTEETELFGVTDDEWHGDYIKIYG